MNVTRVSLAGKVAYVTGAGRGLGRAYALALAERGAKVVVNDLGTDGSGDGSEAAPAQGTVDLIKAKGGDALVDFTDITDRGGVDASVSTAVDHFGGIDILVNNAGICGFRPFLETSLDEFRRYWDIHVAGSINMAQAVWPVMRSRGGGRILLTQSAAGHYGLTGQASYAAAKGAVHGLTRTLAIEAAVDNIQVNAICPGGYSRMHEAAIPDEATLAHMRETMPADLVAPAVVWLVSDACHVTGQVFSVWSGRMARIAIGSGPGLYSSALTPELIAEHYDQAERTAPLFEPTSALDEVAAWADGRITRLPSLTEEFER
jgi:NAD(P)-dependent dehydrogenase (short-subunit alcohol dehydrogenase family)